MTDKPATISEKTHVRLSLIVAGVAAVLPVIAWFTWLAVTINDIQGTLGALALSLWISVILPDYL